MVMPKYLVPLNTGKFSSTRHVSQMLGQLFDVLSYFDSRHIRNGRFRQDVQEFADSLEKKLEVDGWTKTVVGNRYRFKYGGETLDPETAMESVEDKFQWTGGRVASDDLPTMKAKAKQLSRNGYVQHVNKRSNGDYYISDWYDCDSTVASYENGESLQESKSNVDNPLVDAALQAIHGIAEVSQISLAHAYAQWAVICTDDKLAKDVKGKLNMKESKRPITYHTRQQWVDACQSYIKMHPDCYVDKDDLYDGDNCIGSWTKGGRFVGEPNDFGWIDDMSSNQDMKESDERSTLLASEATWADIEAGKILYHAGDGANYYKRDGKYYGQGGDYGDDEPHEIPADEMKASIEDQDDPYGFQIYAEDQLKESVQKYATMDEWKAAVEELGLSFRDEGPTYAVDDQDREYGLFDDGDDFDQHAGYLFDTPEEFEDWVNGQDVSMEPWQPPDYDSMASVATAVSGEDSPDFPEGTKVRVKNGTSYKAIRGKEGISTGRMFLNGLVIIIDGVRHNVDEKDLELVDNDQMGEAAVAADIKRRLQETEDLDEARGRNKKWKIGDVINDEHGHKIGDKDLIDAVKDGLEISDEEWDKLSSEEQIEIQVSWCEPPG